MSEHRVAGLQRPQLVRNRMLIGGRGVDADDGQNLRVCNPADGSVLGTVPTLKVGAGLADGPEQGPLIDAVAVEKVEEHVQDALAHGARLDAGGQRVASIKQSGFGREGSRYGADDYIDLKYLCMAV